MEGASAAAARALVLQLQGRSFGSYVCVALLLAPA
jgi:hypothetical protein